MKNVKSRIVIWMLMISMSIIYLFDKDGEQLGLKIWTDAPLLLVDVASIVGNTIWILGAVFLLAAFGLIYTFTSDEGTSKLDEAIDKEMDNQSSSLWDIRKRKPFEWFTNSMSAIVHVIGLGSGFWFTGTASLIMLGASLMFMHMFYARIRERISEGGDGKEPGIISKNPLV